MTPNPWQVSQVLRLCSQHRLSVVPQGGNTGLAGGCVPIDDEIILSLSRLNRIMAFEEVRRGVKRVGLVTRVS